MIRPFQLDDLVLVQRLGRRAARLNIVQSLLQPQSAFAASLSAYVPWKTAKVSTYVLRQRGHGLIGDGFLQVKKRPGRPELDILLLAPGLDSPHGHPAIWEKLLAHYSQEAIRQDVARLYVDVPDQPLPVNTLTRVGFRTYTHQTIWRLAPNGVQDFGQVDGEIRPQRRADEWPLQNLYLRSVPPAVQAAEGMHNGGDVRTPIMEWGQGGCCQGYVLAERGEVRGAVQVVEGRRGYWLQLWADLLDPDPAVVHQLLRCGLTTISRRKARHPVYVGVCDYHGALGSLLEEYHFAPFTDRAKMVRHVMHWVREPAMASAVVMEAAPGMVLTPIVLRGARGRRGGRRVASPPAPVAQAVAIADRTHAQ